MNKSENPVEAFEAEIYTHHEAIVSTDETRRKRDECII